MVWIYRVFVCVILVMIYFRLETVKNIALDIYDARFNYLYAELEEIKEQNEILTVAMEKIMKESSYNYYMLDGITRKLKVN